MCFSCYFYTEGEGTEGWETKLSNCQTVLRQLLIRCLFLVLVVMCNGTLFYLFPTGCINRKGNSSQECPSHGTILAVLDQLTCKCGGINPHRRRCNNYYCAGLSCFRIDFSFSSSSMSFTFCIAFIMFKIYDEKEWTWVIAFKNCVLENFQNLLLAFLPSANLFI